MATVLEHTQLPALARGFSLLGSGGGGSTTMLELALAGDEHWPLTLHELDDLDPALPCLGAAFVGSTMLLGERLPGEAPFARLIAAAERWLGHPVPVVCSLEGGGLNGLTPFTLAADRLVVDADLTGRAVPGLDQMSLLVDRVPGVVAACDTGAGGVMLAETGRPIDLERVIRAATIQAGGVGGTVFAGFTVGDLVEHSVHGGTLRALELGTAFLHAASAPLGELATALGGRLLGHGRISAVEPDARDPHVNAIGIDGEGGRVHRIITRSETLAFMTDGRVEASAPTIIVALDTVSRDILEVTDLTLARNVAVLELPAPAWWTQRPERLRHVVPSAYGLADLDGAA
ncbi:S-methyl thiohydantoin desulfurase domain-containing protein [Agromyces sp. CCNWLW203]|uniref:S-methyl thiohydantoin desulfurase domain-containing protein n=1 Tax=Agromyces sp. CCNWLW203 TaxID=3112842 RepID=UPI002F962796